MTEVTLFDNDAVLKLSAFQVWDAVSTTQLYPPAILAVAKWSLAKQASKARRVSNIDAFRIAVESFVAGCMIIEPTDVEIQFAISIEEAATALGGELDSGESQLVAVLIARHFSAMVTGDKRAIIALAQVGVEGLTGKIYCLEQVLQIIIASSDWQAVRVKVCSERQMDMAVAMVFACHSEPSIESVSEGLESYIGNLRANAADLLIE